ncbi:hypothetical protein GCM10010517_73520 [Streptosporangium fragile]|uniref:Uncharacterized protein n=1 Tax=Streptosporangium fragile TaxID=46186 RepID=A0ABN3WBK1_9ACTN
MLSPATYVIGETTKAVLWTTASGSVKSVAVAVTRVTKLIHRDIVDPIRSVFCGAFRVLGRT